MADFEGKCVFGVVCVRCCAVPKLHDVRECVAAESSTVREKKLSNLRNIETRDNRETIINILVANGRTSYAFKLLVRIDSVRKAQKGQIWIPAVWFYLHYHWSIYDILVWDTNYLYK